MLCHHANLDPSSKLVLNLVTSFVVRRQLRAAVEGISLGSSEEHSARPRTRSMSATTGQALCAESSQGSGWHPCQRQDVERLAHSLPTLDGRVSIRSFIATTRLGAVHEGWGASYCCL